MTSYISAAVDMRQVAQQLRQDSLTELLNELGTYHHADILLNQRKGTMRKLVPLIDIENLDEDGIALINYLHTEINKDVSK